MGLRITTWNVNGIRNPFAYQPWRDKKTFQAMFDVLEADIVVMQETKIQRKDLRDDMVLVPGWDVHFSLPKHKKGYSGVAIYTRNAACAPIRAEEGVTGALSPPNSSISFCDLPQDQQIGGYPTTSQLADCPLDAATLDSEGRCVILEFPAFVLIGVYSPASRDDTRTDFRLGFLNALDARVRNLIAVGKRVFLTGDLNIIREEIDTANAEEQLRKYGVSGQEYVSTPARRLLNQLLVGGKVIGERDEGREPLLWDICRGFHPGRKGMFTCWETKINARPGNFGSRIDYVLCSVDWKDWFADSNIQEGLIGSDHCPVYAVIKDIVDVNGTAVHIKDIVNPLGMFEGGIRRREWNNKDLLPTSAKLIPEFDRRRNIRDMFMTRSLFDESSTGTVKNDLPGDMEKNSDTEQSSMSKAEESMSPKMDGKRPAEISALRVYKRSKSGGSTALTPNDKRLAKGQSSLKGFFKPKNMPDGISKNISGESESQESLGLSPIESVSVARDSTESPTRRFKEDQDVIDPIVVKESWSKLLSKRVVPRCEHNEPCVSYQTKKPGINCGRSFYMCPRPLGPSGQKEKGSEWRCGIFVWSSDWTGDGT